MALSCICYLKFFILQVMFRMNFLTIMLCLVMRRPYQFYYFVPLISFWYTVQHLFLVIPPKIIRQNPETEKYELILSKTIFKLCVLSLSIFLLFQYKVINFYLIIYWILNNINNLTVLIELSSCHQ